MKLCPLRVSRPMTGNETRLKDEWGQTKKYVTLVTAVTKPTLPRNVCHWTGGEPADIAFNSRMIYVDIFFYDVRHITLLHQRKCFTRVSCVSLLQQALTMESAVVTIYTTYFNTLNKTLLLPTRCIYVFRMVLTINSDYFPKQH
jgi:hypothetical protein